MTKSRTESLLSDADSQLSGIRGYLVSLLETRRGPSRRILLIYAARLRNAASTLEELAK